MFVKSPLQRIKFRPHFVAVDQFSALGGVIAFGDLSFDLDAVGRKPRLLIVQQRDGVLDVLVGTLLGTTLDVLPN